jgi:hypothetical protein
MIEIFFLLLQFKNKYFYKNYVMEKIMLLIYSKYSILDKGDFKYVCAHQYKGENA